MKSEIEKRFKTKIKSINALDKNDLRTYILNKGFYPEGWILPPVFRVEDFEKVVFQKKIDISDVIKIATPHNKLSWRYYSVVNPQKYFELTNLLIDNWDEIKKVLTIERKIFSYSIPAFYGERSEEAVKSFINFTEKDVVIDSYEYEYMLTTDIRNYYGSVYTHSIAWALHEKNYVKGLLNGSKQERSELNKLTGNKIDVAVRACQNNQTNGLPLGPITSDLLSEVILARVDHNITKRAVEDKIRFLGGRYKDDYKILCHSREDAKKLIRIISQEFLEYGLEVNKEKTKIIETHLVGMSRPNKIGTENILKLLNKNVSAAVLTGMIDEIILMKETYPDKNVTRLFLSRLSSGKYFNNDKITPIKAKIIISKFIKLSEIDPGSLPLIIGFLAKIYNLSSNIDEFLTRVINNQISKSQGAQDDFRALWFTYLAIKCELSANKPKIDGNAFLDSLFCLIETGKCKNETLFNENITKAKFYFPEEKDKDILEEIMLFPQKY